MFKVAVLKMKDIVRLFTGMLLMCFLLIVLSKKNPIQNIKINVCKINMVRMS